MTFVIHKMKSINKYRKKKNPEDSNAKVTQL